MIQTPGPSLPSLSLKTDPSREKQSLPYRTHKHTRKDKLLPLKEIRVHPDSTIRASGPPLPPAWSLLEMATKELTGQVAGDGKVWRRALAWREQ